jgi:hypothetical protein
MSAVSAARLLVLGTAWRLAGVAAAGQALVSAAGGPDPDRQVLAGMLLTRAGDRSVPLLADALASSGPAADPRALVDILASIGTDQARTALRAATRSPRSTVAAAADRALHSLDQQRDLGS